MILMLKYLLAFILSGSAFSIEVQKPFYEIEYAKYYFKDFIHTYNKNYPNEVEWQKRLKIFTENLVRLNKRNTIDSAIHGINQFTDLDPQEFSERYTGLLPPRDGISFCVGVKDADIVTSNAPASFDWREKNVVTPVKNQGGCGSCYAFSTIGNIESQYAIKNRKQVDLSEQQLVSCSDQNSGCGGGLMTISMQDVINNGGIEFETDYPYMNEVNNISYPCKFTKELAKVQLSGCTNYDLNDENKLREVLYNVGPISIAVFGNPLSGYHGGVLKDCGSEMDPVNHAILLVGYGTDNVDGPYWIVKNSWSTNWGEQGYGRIARGSNTCRLMNDLTASGVMA